VGGKRGGRRERMAEREVRREGREGRKGGRGWERGREGREGEGRERGRMDVPPGKREKHVVKKLIRRKIKLNLNRQFRTPRGSTCAFFLSQRRP
jgi:hypothetical protein